MASDDSLVSVYRCADGRDFPVRWASAEEAQATWFWDPEHSPGPVPPLDAAIWKQCRSGTSRARAEWGFAETDVFIGGDSFAYFNGFSYWHQAPSTPEDEEKAATANERLRARFASGGDFWEKECEPRAIEAVRHLRDASGAEPVASLIETFGYGFEQTFLMWGIDRDHPSRSDFLKAEFGDDADRIAAALTTGYPSATLEADQALWRLAQQAGAAPAVKVLLTRDGLPSADELRRVEGGAAFASAFDAYLDAYGWRALDWNASSRTLRECPEASLEVIRRTVIEELPQPSALLAEAARARDALVKDLEARFQADPDKLREFRNRVQIFSRYVALREGRALWQLSLCGALRHALLSRGERLVDSKLLADAEDIFYLLPAEIGDALAGGRQVSDIQALVRGRRAEHAKWLGVTPPAMIGGKAGDAPESAAAEAKPELPAGARELKGTPASAGRVTAVARVLVSFEEYARLGQGEVLICATTSPSWTPLFAVAGGIVSDGGGMLSHTAIAAREYGLPAVVGVRGATHSIPDGATVTVDGGAGTVRIEE